MTLPDANDPLVLADGSRIDPATGSIIKNHVVVPTASEAVEKVTSIRRELIDLPAPPAQMNVMSLVAMYGLMGIRSDDIAIAIGLTLDQVEQIKKHESFGKVVETITEAVLEADSDTVRQLITKNTMNAAERVGALMHSENEAVSLAASKDVLDRGGHRPVDVIEHRHQMEGALTIVHVKRDETDSLPVLDLVNGE